ncbi:MAG: gliding motility lipoprotein GldH [Chitinophagaceae bacterium]|nr:gliding motility lipoprotein GldH [Chitinophagaceae bacterium]
MRRHFLLFFIASAMWVAGCGPLDLYEKNVIIPKHRWKSEFRPQFSFIIKDSSRPYQLYFTIRHKDKYAYNNIYIKLTALNEKNDTVFSRIYDVKLGSDETGWLGSGMDDIYDHRVRLEAPEKWKPGAYRFIVEQIMREDPLEHVLAAGIRLEKK